MCFQLHFKRRFVLLLIGLLLILMGEVSQPVAAQLQCTFTARKDVNLRGGPGISYKKVGGLNTGETFNVTGQKAGVDGYVWWQSADDEWVRSDLGTSDCPATCGNTVCEYGETISSCAKDCGSTVKSGSDKFASTSTACIYKSCAECIAAYPCFNGTCSQTSCELNEYGCPVCSTSP
ncbi:MAG TPA: SH3 domain-containing protein [Phototrophicaceae bacterium]|nr:SH3 domain-containing protein [Phototrophicaceae bacterium]